MSAVHWAVLHQNPQQVRLLTRAGSGVNRRDSSMRTPMHLACDIANENLASSIAKILLQNGARVSQKDEAGVSTFLYACTQQRTQLVELMINEREIDWADVDHHGNTALHLAATTGNKTLTRMIMAEMLKYRLDIERRNAHGETPRTLASKYGHTECAEVLRDEGGACVTVRGTIVYNTLKDWQGIPTHMRSLKLSCHFRNRFPEVCERLEKIQLKQPLAKKTPQDWTKTGVSHYNKGRSIKLHVIPRLIELYREQFMTSYRPPVKPKCNEQKDANLEEKNIDRRKMSFPPQSTENAEEPPGASTISKRRKYSSCAGLPFHRLPGENRSESSMRRFSSTIPPSYKAASGPWRGTAMAVQI